MGSPGAAHILRELKAIAEIDSFLLDLKEKTASRTSVASEAERQEILGHFQALLSRAWIEAGRPLPRNGRGRVNATPAQNLLVRHEVASVNCPEMDRLFSQLNPPEHARGAIPGCESSGNVPTENGRLTREGRPKLPATGGEGQGLGRTGTA